MQSGTSHSGHRPHGRRTAPPPFPGFQSAVIRVHLRRSLGFQLSTVDSDRRAQPPCFDNLPHSSTTSQTSPLCFHNLTKPFSRSSFLLTTIQNPRGCHPPFANSCIINNFFAPLFTISSEGRAPSLANPKKVEPFSPPDAILSREGLGNSESRAKVPGKGSLRGKEVNVR